MEILIRGDGVSAYCCAHLLHQAGLQVALQPVARSRLPVIVLGDQAVALVRDVFGRPGILRNLPRIDKRIVAWGPGAKAMAVEHSAIAVSEEALLSEIRPAGIPECIPDREAGCTVVAAPPLPHHTGEERFGSRRASVVPVTLRAGSDPHACRIESVSGGWLFLIPGAPGPAWLLAVGGAPEALLDESRVVAPEIAQCHPAVGQFPSYARIAAPLCGPGWLACGTAAMAFDPICGDGTALAVREAILASAVIRALSEGGDTISLLSHYQARLTAGFQRHLVLCRGFYESGGATSLWRSERDAIDRGIQWCHAQLGDNAGFRYRLRGFELEAVR